MRKYSQLTEVIEVYLTEILPHGSGIDCDWQFIHKPGTVHAKNSFHCMNDAGFYDGYADFTVIIPLDDVEGFKLQFNGDYSQQKNKKYLLRDYLEDTIHYALTT